MHPVFDETNPERLTLVDILRWRAQHEPQSEAYTFLLDGETKQVQMTYADLDGEARRIAALLQDRMAVGERVLLLYPPGLEYVAAIFGCFSAGMVAVPAYPPRLNQSLMRIQTILQDAEVTVALTTSTILSSLRRTNALDPWGKPKGYVQDLQWIATDTMEPQGGTFYRVSHVDPEALALLQYTSGSTSSPKGVMLTHTNLVQNAALIQEGMSLTSEDRGLFWLPPYHDMGLMGGILQALYTGFPATLMAPAAFLQQPLRWLQALSSWQATVSGAPNFAYDLCVKKATEDAIKDLRLSSWAVAFTGAEPIRAETLSRFAQTFAPCGFRFEAFYPCYGLAETTLFVSGSRRLTKPRIRAFEREALEAGRVIETTGDQEPGRLLVGCGYLRQGQEVVIVDPQMRIRCVDGELGEIWVRGPNVAQGYWGKPEETRETFQAFLRGDDASDPSDEGPFLRTGDLGFCIEKELFIAGRIKDLIIIRGRNLYPQDIERVVEKSHPLLRQGCCAAFSVDAGHSPTVGAGLAAALETPTVGAGLAAALETPTVGAGLAAALETPTVGAGLAAALETPTVGAGLAAALETPTVGAGLAPALEGSISEQLVVVQEVVRHADNVGMQEAIQRICRAVLSEFDVEVAAIALLRAGTIPKTTSGKIQRHACRSRFLADELNTVSHWSRAQEVHHLLALPNKGEEAGASPLAPAHSPENAQEPGTSFVGTGLAPVREMVGHVDRTDRDRPATRFRTGASPVPTDGQNNLVGGRAGSAPAFGRQAYTPSMPEIVDWLVEHIAEHKHIAAHVVDRHAPFVQFGLNSLEVIGFSGALEQWLGCSLSPTLLYDYPSIDVLARYLEDVLRDQSPERNESTLLPRVASDPTQQYMPFPSTDVQQAYWIGRGSLFELGNVGNHAYIEVEAVGLDLARALLILRQLIKRHPMLRAVMLPDGQQQVFEHVPPVQVERIDLSGLEQRELVEQLAHIRDAMDHQVLQVEQWPAWAIRVSQLHGQRVRIHISMEVLFVDAGSLSILLQEFLHLYHEPEVSLPPLDLSFRDYVTAAVQLQNLALYRRAHNYWQERLPHLPAAPALPLVIDPASLSRPRFVPRSARMEATQWQRLKTRGAQAGLTPSGILLAAFAEVLTLWSKNPRFCINLTIFQRLPLHQQVDEIVGDFTSSLLLAVDNVSQESFEQRARRIQEQMWRDLNHYYYSGVRVLRDLARIQGSKGGAYPHPPQASMPVVFTSLLAHEIDVAYPGPWQEMAYYVTQTPQIWLDHQVLEVAGNLVLYWQAVEALFPPGLLDAMFGAYTQLLERLATDDEVWRRDRLSGVLLPPSQLALFTRINATDAPIADTLLHSFFLEQARLQPDQPAVISARRTLTYQEVSKGAMLLAYQLRQWGVCPNQLVAVVMEKGWEQVVAVLGVLLSGAAYLPIDPKLPQERVIFLLDDGEVAIVLTQSWIAEQIAWSQDVKRICVDSLDLSKEDIPALTSVQSPDDLAYVIYTSGSTGVPKGVMIDHRGAVNTILDINRRFAVNRNDRVLALSALNFDLSVYDIFGLLAVGGTIVIPAEETLRDPAAWLDMLVRERVTLWNTVPVLLQMLVEYTEACPETLSHGCLRLALVSGDWIPVTLPERLRSVAQGTQATAPIEIISLGGATEASIWSICYPICGASSQTTGVDPSWKNIPYGQPLSNQRFFVLNEMLELCPIWVPGHLYIAGIGLARGYWRDEAKTQASFFHHPRTGERLYRTGDLGRYLPDGNIEFMGREDFQVKVQGHRIELGEIEQTLLLHPAVQSAVTTVITEPHDDKRLMAYVVLRESVGTGQGQGPVPTASESVGTGLAPVRVPTDEDYDETLHHLAARFGQTSIRKEIDKGVTIELAPPADLAHPAGNPEIVRTYKERLSYRTFLPESIPFRQFSDFLRSLSQIELEGLPKYRYPSAGGIYPVQTYVAIKARCVEGVPEGIYYFNPQSSQLILLSGRVHQQQDIHAPINQPIFAESAFSLFLIGDLTTISSLYGDAARDFCLLEAGYMSQLLMMTAPQYQIGLCPVGGLDFEQIRDVFMLTDHHLLLHTLLGGRVDPSKATGWSFLPQNTVASAISQLAVADEPAPIVTTAALREFLKEKLPEYMLPSTVMILDRLPLNVNGKVDRKNLPLPEPQSSRKEIGHRAPTSPLEQTIAAVWQEVLGLAQVGVHDNFFDLGGNSLLMVRAYTKLRKILDRDLSIIEMFFQYPTIHALAEALSQGAGRQSQSSPSAETDLEKEEGSSVGAEGGGKPRPYDPRPGSPLTASSLGDHPTDPGLRDHRGDPCGRPRHSEDSHTEARQMHDPTVSETDIAIIGMSSRLPGSKNTHEFWQNLQDGKECITEVSDDQLRAALLKSLGYIPETDLTSWLNNPNYVGMAAGLEDIDLFAATFFGYNPTEAAMMDPQQRLFLECAWEALEDAAYDPHSYEGLIGVYAGAEMNLYYRDVHAGTMPSVDSILRLMSNANDYLTTRVSYKLNLKGPSLAVQSACSTSLVAVHIACQSLKSRECDMALAGGVVVRPTQEMGYFYQEDGFLSPDGHCRPFDAQAQGTLFANGGVGVVVLKRLTDALADGDNVYAVIKGSAINNDGSFKTGYTAPSIDGQVKVLLDAMAAAVVDPASISYIETHGTATPLGDPVEIAALTQAFDARTQKKSFCAIGSLKSNMGHLGPVAGIAGLIKTSLALKHKMLPPSLHYEQSNPQIDFANSPFYVNTQLTTWDTDALPRRAGVSAFGIGGTNAHVILEEAPDRCCKGRALRRSCASCHRFARSLQSWELLILSAKTSSALEQMRVNLLDHLKDHPDLNLADLAFTLQVGRRAFPHRLMLVCQTVAEAVSQLETKQCFLSVTPPEEQGVVFMFPGQGPQYVNMGRELYDQEPIFRQQVDTCAALLVPYLHRDLREVIYPPVGQEATAQDQLEHMLLAQPALFVIEYALAQLWLHKGIRPAAMIGHSIGEYVAACLAGVLSLQDALFLVALRGRLMDQLKSGAMLAVSLPEEEVLPLLGARLSLAAHNSMSDCVVSGPADDIGDLQRSLTEQQIPCQALRVSRASHSQMLEPVLAQFTHEVSKLRLHPPTLPYISNLTGQWITEQEVTDPEYWTRHWRQTVRFAEGIQLLLDVPAPILLEVGPGRSLSTLAQRMVDRHCSLYALRHRSAQPWLILSSLRHPQAPVSDVAFLLNTCGRLWCAGIAIDWSQWVETTPASTEQRRRLSLPTYPFERERYWIFPAPNPVGTGLAPVRTSGGGTLPPVLPPTGGQAVGKRTGAVGTGLAPVPTAPVRFPTAPFLSLQLPSTRQQRPHLQTTYVAPRNEMEQQIAAIWQEVLGIELVGIQDNFFEVGGDSLVGLYTINELREAFKVDLSLPLLLKETPTVEGMAKVIRQKQMELIDDEQLAEILQNISQISEEEALQLLEKNSSEPEGER